LISVLIDHVFYISGPPNPHPALITSLLPHFFALTKAYPAPAARCFISRLSYMHDSLKRGLAARAAASSHANINANIKTWPGLGELMFFRLAGTLWPTSDRTHAVLSPARLLMASYLGLCRVRTHAELASGLFLCTLFAQWEASRAADATATARLVPEALNFLAGALVRLAPHRFGTAQSLPGLFPVLDLFVGSASEDEEGKDLEDEGEGHSPGRRYQHQHAGQRRHHSCRLALDAAQARHVVVSVDKPDLVALINNSSTLDGQRQGSGADEQGKADLLGVVFTLLQRYAEMYITLPAFIELFSPVQAVLEGLDADALPAPLTVSPYPHPTKCKILNVKFESGTNNNRRASQHC
jgi:nucleolar protein 14